MIVKSPIELVEFAAKNNVLLLHCPDKRDVNVEIEFNEGTFGKGELGALAKNKVVELVGLNVLFSNSNEVYNDYLKQRIIANPHFKGSYGLNHAVPSRESYHANIIFSDCIINVAEQNELHIYDTVFRNCKIFLHPLTKFKRCSFEDVEFLPASDSTQSFCIHNFDNCRFANITSNNILLSFGLIGYKVNDKEKPESTKYTLNSYVNFSHRNKKVTDAFITTLYRADNVYQGVITTVFENGEASFCHGAVILHVKNYTGRFNYYLSIHVFNLTSNVYHFGSSYNLGLESSKFVIDESEISEAFLDKKYNKGGYCIDYLNYKDNCSALYLSELDSLPILDAIRSGDRSCLDKPKDLDKEPAQRFYRGCC
jgi:hypothetical protein